MEKREEIRIGFCCILFCLRASQLFWEDHCRSEGTLTFCSEFNYIVTNNSNINSKFSNICVLIIIVTITVTRKRQVFLNPCLRGSIIKFWSRTISKEELYQLRLLLPCWFEGGRMTALHFEKGWHYCWVRHTDNDQWLCRYKTIWRRTKKE